jgi:GTPase
MKFLDEVKIYLKSGDGGNGCVSFRREKFVEHGGPDGGNGGKGGNIIIECVNNLNTLIDYRYRQHFKAKNGTSGMGKNRHGARGENLILKVPVGTQILSEDKSTIIADFTAEGQSEIILRGSDGGVGNAYYKSSVNQSPTKAKPGKLGDELWIWMQLKLISDAGLVGLPNAGKSTFLSKITSAKPKIADYPFTTLRPHLGVTYIDDYDFVIADIPGLIEGASDGLGLGHRFLKHIERCGAIIHLIDISQEDIHNSYKIIRKELDDYGVTNKTEIIVLNKTDCLSPEEVQIKVDYLSDKLNKKIYSISCFDSKNIIDMQRVIKEALLAAKEAENAEEEIQASNTEI